MRLPLLSSALASVSSRMAPRGAALIPLVAVLGTTAAAAVLAHQFVPKYFENKHKKRRQLAADANANANSSADESNQDSTIANESNKMASTKAQAPISNKQTPTTRAVETRSSMLAAVMLQDPFLLISALGVCVMVVAVLVSLALVSVRDDVASLNDLQMFGPLMLIAMGLISLGMVLSMVSPQKPAHLVEELELEDEEEENKNKNITSEADAIALREAAQASDQGFLYNYYKNKYGDRENDQEVDQDGQPKKRVSKCPFGF